MTLPSLELLKDKATSAAKRFPAALILSIAGTTAAILLIGAIDESRESFNILLKCLLTALFGIPLLVSAALLHEGEASTSKKYAITFHAIALIMMGIFYLSLPDTMENGTRMDTIRNAILIGLSFLTVTFLPYIRHYQNSESIWSFIDQLIGRVVITGIFTAGLFIGMTIIYLSLNFLFGINISETLYPKTWIFIVGIIGGWFYLSGIPQKLQSLKVNEFPKLLRHFMQYVLIPLLGIYLFILYTYLLKIIISQNWPEGGVVYLILGYALMGIVTYLSLYPLQLAKKDNWVQTGSRWFFILLIPLLILYFAAISIRIADYGITENRYLIVALGIYLSIICGYFLTSSKRYMFIVPSTLTAILFLSIIGPWSMFNVSKASQLDRLTNLLEKSNILVNGKVSDDPSITIPEGENTESIRSIVYHITDTYGHESLLHLFSEKAQEKIKNANELEKTNTIASEIGVEAYPDSFNLTQYQYFGYISQGQNAPVEIKNGGYLVDISLDASKEKTSQNPSLNIYSKTYHVAIENSAFIMSSKSTPDTIIDLAPFLKKAENAPFNRDNGIPQEDLTVNFTHGDIQGVFYIKEISGQKKGAAYKVFLAKGTLLLGK